MESRDLADIEQQLVVWLVGRDRHLPQHTPVQSHTWDSHTPGERGDEGICDVILLV